MSPIQTRKFVAKASVGLALIALTAFGCLAADAVQPQQAVQPQAAKNTQVQAKLNNQSSTSRKPGAFDSEGKPLVLPHDSAPIMEFSGSAYLGPADKARKAPSSQQAKGRLQDTDSLRRGKSTPQDQDNRPYVANHPNCRWLDSRMDHLEQQLNSIGRGAHHSDELRERQREWRCLRCGGEGPAVYDLDACRQPEAKASFQR